MRALERKQLTVSTNLAEYCELSDRARAAWQTVPQLIREILGLDPDFIFAPESKRLWEMKQAHERLTRLGQEPVAWDLPATADQIAPPPDPQCSGAALKRMKIVVPVNASEFFEVDARALKAGISASQFVRQCCGFEYRSNHQDSYSREDEEHNAHARLVRLGLDPTAYGLPAEMPETIREICADLEQLISRD